MTHTCHAEHCDKPVKPEMLMCAKHWRMVPKDVKFRVYRYYRKGQCDDKKPSAEYLAAARSAINVVATKERMAMRYKLF
jgi:hypothetical protein